jgi:hypothetical protein
LKEEKANLLESTKISIFKGKEIRKTFYQDEWWFSVVDVVGVLTDSADSGAYWRKLKQRLIEEGSEVVTFCHGLKLESTDGKNILPTVPTQKAYFVSYNLFHPLKQNLSNVGWQK